MRSKLLFVLGIVVAHGALGAAWVQQDSPRQRVAVTTCVNVPGELPDFTPPRELFAMLIVPVDQEVMRP
jgi:hypothetical protein